VENIPCSPAPGSAANRHVLDNLPVPDVIVSSANGAAPTVVNAHARTKIEADRSKDTGQGGKGEDVALEDWAFRSRR
jgi:hypothetical protein